MTVARFITGKLLPVLDKQKKEGLSVVYVTPHGEGEAGLIFQTYLGLVEFYKYACINPRRNYAVVFFGDDTVTFEVMTTKTFKVTENEDAEALDGKLVYRG